MWYGEGVAMDLRYLLEEKASFSIPPEKRVQAARCVQAQSNPAERKRQILAERTKALCEFNIYFKYVI